MTRLVCGVPVGAAEVFVVTVSQFNPPHSVLLLPSLRVLTLTALPNKIIYLLLYP